MTGERLSLRLGPLRWVFEAHGAGGREMLGELAGRLMGHRLRATPHRIVHLLRHRPRGREGREIALGRLPRAAASAADGALPAEGWRFKADDCGHLSAWHAASRHAFLIRGALEGAYAARFWLPWPLLAVDALALRGGILHGGLAASGSRALIVTAPPGGGKTTTLGRLPDPWESPCDDACLVWPRAGGFLASPLPTYGAMLGINGVSGQEGPWDTARRFHVAGVLFVRKGGRTRLHPLGPVAAARPLYLALSEHPGVLLVRDLFRERLFRSACALARHLPCGTLETTVGGDLQRALGQAFSRG